MDKKRNTKQTKKTWEEVSPFATTYYCHSNYTTATLYCTTNTAGAKRGRGDRSRWRKE